MWGFVFSPGACAPLAKDHITCILVRYWSVLFPGLVCNQGMPKGDNVPVRSILLTIRFGYLDTLINKSRSMLPW
jgi:hypothetical protein